MSLQCSDTDGLAVLNLVGEAAKAAYICSRYDVATLGVPAAVTRYLIQQDVVNANNIAETQFGLDVSFLLTATYQVFVMQAGFALYAAGVIRSKNIVNILTKNFIDACVGAVMFYLVGFAFAFGEGKYTNGFIGFWNFGLVADQKKSLTTPSWQLFLWNWAFCSAAATVLSGAVAERATFVAYLMYSVFISGWVYPVVAHWFWASSGWLNPNYIRGPLFKAGAIDFAGSGVVHTVAGVASFYGAWLVGPRYGRFEKGADPDAFQGYNPANYVLGTFLLWFGWYGFNPGSLQRIRNTASAVIVARTAVNTTLSGGFGAVAILLLTYAQTRKWNLLATCSGALSGMVAITANCSVVEPWAAALCGVVAATIFVYGEKMEIWAKIDDPVSAFPMHGLCGLWGVAFSGLLARKEYIEGVYLRPVYAKRYGLLYGGDGWLLAAQVVGMCSIVAWVSVHMFAFFWLLRRAGILRVRVEDEVVGLDVASHGQVPTHEAINVYADNINPASGGSMPYKKRALASGGGIAGVSPQNPLGPGSMSGIIMRGNGTLSNGTLQSQPGSGGATFGDTGAGGLDLTYGRAGGGVAHLPNPNDSKTGAGWGELYRNRLSSSPPGSQYDQASNHQPSAPPEPTKPKGWDLYRPIRNGPHAHPLPPIHPPDESRPGWEIYLKEEDSRRGTDWDPHNGRAGGGGGGWEPWEAPSSGDPPVASKSSSSWGGRDRVDRDRMAGMWNDRR